MNRRIYVFDEHNEAFFFWYKARKEASIGGPMDLLHVDAHADMAIPSNLAVSLYAPEGLTESEELEYYRRFVRNHLEISDFILPAVLKGLVRNVYFVSPAWRNHKIERRKMNVCSFFGEGKILKSGLRRGELSNPQALRAFPDLRVFRFDGIPLERVPRNREFILDFDLDFFACRDSPTNQLSYRLEITAEQYRARGDFLKDRTLPFSEVEFVFTEENGRAFVRISPRKREERAYLPARSEVVAAIEHVVASLAEKRIRPSVVTVCRSCFSGYTPPEYVGFIETELKRALLGVAEWGLSEAD